MQPESLACIVLGERNAELHHLDTNDLDIDVLDQGQDRRKPRRMFRQFVGKPAMGRRAPSDASCPSILL